MKLLTELYLDFQGLKMLLQFTFLPIKVRASAKLAVKALLVLHLSS